MLPGAAPIELVLDVPGERAPSGCSAPALRLRGRCAYVGGRVLANPGYSREGRVLVRPACCRGLRPSSWCSTFPGSVLLRGVAHRRYACVVCAHTSASGCSPTRGIPGGMSTGSSAVLPGTAPIELVLDVPGERAPSGCSAPALRLRCLCAYVGERVLANPGIPGGMSTGSSAVLPGTAPIELVLDVPGERAPSGCSAPALRLRCLCAYVGERVLANPGIPGRDEHQPVRGAAGDCAHRAGARRSQGAYSFGV